jgi:2-methylcitrate dehydratase PrpD
MYKTEQYKPNLSKALVAQLMRIRQVGLSPDTAHQAKRCLLDYLAATYAGGQMLHTQATNLLAIHAGTEGGVSAIGFDRKVSLQTATFVNGLTSHVAEMDDGVRHGMIHPGSPIFSALIPAAELFQVAGEDLLMGIVIGYEAAVRLAAAIQPTHYQRGYHPTATCGTMGAALGLAAMLQLDEVATEHALAAASVTASGTLKVIGEGSDLKPFNTAQAALSGLMAALTARAGFAGPANVLSGPTGFLQICADSCDVAKLTENDSQGLWIHQVYVKPYAACRHAHPAIEASLSLRTDPALRPEMIESMVITTYGGLAGRHDHRAATTVAAAKMSIPVATAIALITGRAGIEAFTAETLGNPSIATLASKVSIIDDPELTRQVPGKREARVECFMRNGELRQMTVVYPKGEPENPMSDDELIQKFNELTAYGGIQPERARRIREGVFKLPKGLPNLIAEL